MKLDWCRIYEMSKLTQALCEWVKLFDMQYL